MADLFYTILIVWVLWQIFGGGRKMHVFHHHKYQAPKKREGDVSINQPQSAPPKKKSDEGEYIDFEEVK